MEQKEENLVKKTCRELGITQKELAEMMGISRQSVNNWANNRTDPPKIFSRLIELLNIEKRFKTIKEQFVM
ncbi:putative transcriptional regulator [Thiovulum sp. ES]|nr:putative transcriptional regulator [Thiovulum sp. ES]